MKGIYWKSWHTPWQVIRGVNDFFFSFRYKVLVKVKVKRIERGVLEELAHILASD